MAQAQIWIGVADYAALAGITEQAARKRVRKALTASHGGLLVRAVQGRGGRGGVRYEVALSSLSEAYQEAFRGTSTALVPAPLKQRDPDAYVPRVQSDFGRALELHKIIEPAVRWGMTSKDRGAAVRFIATAHGMPERTVWRHVANFRRHGINGLARRLPSDAGKPRVYVSRQFDAAYAAGGYPAEHLPMLSQFVDEQLKGLWKSRAGDAGAPDLGHLAKFLLWEKCEKLGLNLTPEQCVIGIRRVRKWEVYKVVNLRNNNAKAFQDTLPRIRRDWTKHEPMQCVVGDVKHLDVSVTRADGTTTYPKMIGFMDAGTGRVFSYLVLCPQRRSITQELVIEAFCAMASHPLWGFPEQLYLDNGSEFGGLDKIIPALELLNRDAGREIIHAKPYNASSKPIEPLFARLDRYCFSALPGYTGPDRMAKKTQNVGREPEAWGGTWESFVDTVGGLIAYFHQRKMGGQWGDRSPNEIFQQKVDAGWRPTHPKPLALEMAFCAFAQRTRSKQGIKHDGRLYVHPELHRIPIQSEVQLMIPWRKDEPPVIVIPGVGPVQLSYDLPFAAGDSDGAREAGRRQQSYRKNIAEMASDGPIVDPVAVKRRIAAKIGPHAIPGRTRFLDQGAEIHELTTTRRQLDDAEIVTDLAERRRAREKRITENLLREQSRGK